MNIFRRLMGSASPTEESSVQGPDTQAAPAAPELEQVSFTYQRIDVEHPEPEPELADAASPAAMPIPGEPFIAESFSFGSELPHPDAPESMTMSEGQDDSVGGGAGLRSDGDLVQASAAQSDAASDHEQEIDIHAVGVDAVPTVGAAQSVSVGAAQSTSDGGVEHQDDWSAGGAASDPDQPLVLGNVYNPAGEPPAEQLGDEHEVEYSVLAGAAPPPPPDALTGEGGEDDARPNPAGDGTTEHFFTTEISDGRTDAPDALAGADAEEPQAMHVDVFLKLGDVPGETRDTTSPGGVASDDLAEDPHAAITGYLEVPDIAGESRPAPAGDGTTEQFFTVQIAEARNDPSDDGPSTLGESAGDGGGVPAVRQESLNNKYAENMPDDAPSDGTSNTLLASESPPAPDAGEETYLQVTLENAQITSYQLGGADDGPSTLAELGDTSETGEAVVQHGQTDLSFLLEHADDLPAGDELEEPEL